MERIIPKEALYEALRRGKLRQFLSTTGLSAKELERQSRISRSMWLMWMKERMPVSRREVNEIINNIRQHEARGFHPTRREDQHPVETYQMGLTTVWNLTGHPVDRELVRSIIEIEEEALIAASGGGAPDLGESTRESPKIGKGSATGADLPGENLDPLGFTLACHKKRSLEEV